MIIPFILLNGQAQEAISFYETVFAVTKKEVYLYKEMPEEVKAHFTSEADNFVAHSEIVMNGSPFWIADCLEPSTVGNRVMLSAYFTTVDELRAAFEKLKTGGAVVMEPEKTFYSELYGAAQDRFGVTWNLICMNEGGM